MTSTHMILAMLLGVVPFAIVTILIAADRKRYLAGFDLEAWRERSYISLLPNALQQLHDHGFRRPWPMAVNALSAFMFKISVHPLFRERAVSRRKDFLQQHMTLQALIEILRPYLDDAILGEQIRLATLELARMKESADRDRLVYFVQQARASRINFHRTLTAPERDQLAEFRQREFFQLLRRTNAIFHEHGFCLLPELDTLRLWSEMEGIEMAQNLPRLKHLGNPALFRRRRSAA